MIGPLPPRPSGSGPEAVWAQWLWDQMSSGERLMRVPGAAVKNTTRGKAVLPAALPQGLSVRMLALAAPTGTRPAVVEDDYLVCRAFDGAGFEGSKDIYVAKQFKHRCSLVGETVLGTAYTYAYADDPSEPAPKQNKIRTVTDPGSNTEQQRIVPPWCPGDVIYAVTCRTGVIRTVSSGGGDITVGLLLLDCCSSRQWARIAGT